MVRFSERGGRAKILQRKRRRRVLCDELRESIGVVSQRPGTARGEWKNARLIDRLKHRIQSRRGSQQRVSVATAKAKRVHGHMRSSPIKRRQRRKGGWNHNAVHGQPRIWRFEM